MASVSDGRLSRARYLAAGFLLALAIEAVLHPLNQLLELGGIGPPAVRGHIMVGTHELILIGLAIALLIRTVDWPLILAPRPLSGFGRGVMLAVPFLAPIAIAALFVSPVQLPSQVELWVLLLVFAGSALLVAVAEELLLRGLLQQWLERRLSPRAIVWIQGILFALIHLIDRDVNPFSILFFFLGGAVLTLLIFRWRTVWVPVGVHFAWDSVAFSLQGTQLRGRELAGLLGEPSPALIGTFFIVALTAALILLSQGAIVREVLERRRFEAAA